MCVYVWGGIQHRQLTAKSFITFLLQRRTCHTEHCTRGSLDLSQRGSCELQLKKKKENHTAQGGPTVPPRRGCFFHLAPQRARQGCVGPEGDPRFALCNAQPIPSSSHIRYDGTSKTEAAWSWHSGFSKAIVLGSSCPLLASGGHQTGVQARVKMLEDKFRILLLRCRKALPPSPSRRRSCGRCSGRCPHC